MKPEGLRTPQRAVGGVREIDDRPRDVVEHNGTETARTLHGHVLDDRPGIVVDERIVQGVQVHKACKKRGGAAKKQPARRDGRRQAVVV